MKEQLQQVVVRVVASELDRRARPIEDAVRELQRRVGAVEADGVPGSANALAPLHHSVASLTAANDRSAASLESVGKRLAEEAQNNEKLAAEVRSIRADVSAIQAQLSQVLAVLERLGSAR